MGNRYGTTSATLLVDSALRASDRTAREVAAEIGVLPNVVSMIRTGALALPAARCASLARALGLDPAVLARACIESYRDNRAWRAVGAMRAPGD